MISDFGPCQFGVDYSIPPHELLQSMLADSQNVVVNSAGLPTGRGGSTQINAVSLGSRVTSFFEQRTGATRNKLCSYGTVIALHDTGTGEFVDKNTGLTSGKMLQWVNFAGKAIAVNEGADNPQYFTDASTYGDLAGSPPKGLTVAEWSNRLWFGGDSTDVALLTGSDLNDPTTYTGGGGATAAVSQTVGDSKDPITGMFGFFDYLLIGKANNLYKVSGAPATDATTLRIDPVYSKGTDNIGFTSPWAITQVGNDVIFLDGFDIKRLSAVQEFGDVETATIIPHLSDYIKSIADKDYLQYTQFIHYKKEQQIWVSIPTGATTHYVFVLDYRFKQVTGRYSFYPMSGLAVNVFGSVEDGNINDIYYGDETGFVSQLDKGLSDGGTAIESYVVYAVSGNSPENGILGNHTVNKGFLNSELFVLPVNAISLSMYYAKNLMDSEQVRTSGNYTLATTEAVSGWTGTGVKQKRIRFYGVSAKTLMLKLYRNSLNENFTINPSTIEYMRKSKNSFV